MSWKIIGYVVNLLFFREDFYLDKQIFSKITTTKGIASINSNKIVELSVIFGFFSLEIITDYLKRL